jgi:serine phosphatase RsbU (regulator of sigma subunit)
MWFGTQGGISRYDGEEFYRPFTTEDGLAHDIIVAIHRDPDGILWLGTWGGGVSRYDGKEFINFTTEDGLANGHVRLIYHDAEGLMWFGTDGGGVLCYDGNAWSSLDARDGLTGNAVYSIIQDAKGFLWFGTEGGITRYRKSTTPPRAHIISVTTDRAYHDLSAIPALTPGTRITIEYSRCRIQAFEKSSSKKEIQAFRKGLSEKEMDSDWLKPTVSDTFDFVLGEPGTYTFEVQAIDRDLNYSEPASVELEVIPDPRNHRIIQLEEHIREQELAELERVHQELEDARQIQQSLLPDSPPDIAGFEIAGISLPAREVNGDFYNYLPLGANTGIVLADVTGKSVKAAMVAALASGTLNAEIGDRQDIWDSPAEILRRLNIRLQPHLIRGMYTAMSLGIVRPEQKQIILSNAGMPYPIMKRRDKVRELEANGMPLGLVDGAEYEDLSIDLEAGDLVIFCSDGVIEAVNKANEMYQTERLLESIQQASPGLSAQEMINLVVKDVTAFIGDEEASDDITVIVLRCEE